MRTILRQHAVGWLLTWLGMWWLWMLLVGEWNSTEWIAASLTATGAATAGRVAWHVGRRPLRIPLAIVWQARTVPLMILVDFGLVMYALGLSLVRRRVVRGEFVVRPAIALGEDPTAAGTRAFATMASLYSPNAYVVDTHLETATTLFHDLIPHRPSEEPA